MRKIFMMIICLSVLAIGGTAIADNVNLYDVSTARKFLLALPDECGKSYMTTLSDGTVVIQVICNGERPLRSSPVTMYPFSSSILMSRPVPQATSRIVEAFLFSSSGLIKL